MIAGVRFLLAQAALVLLGGGFGFHPSVRSLSPASRITLSFCAGAVGLTLEATIYSWIGVPWTIPGLAAPLLLLSAICAAAWWRKPPGQSPDPLEMRRSVAVWCCLVCGVALLYLILCFVSSAAASTDYLLFWGVKAVRFANHRGISAEFLRYPFATHAVPDYPPLLPIVQAWGCLAAGLMPWRVVPALSAMWVVAAIPIIFERCRRRSGDDGAAALTAFWTAAISISLVYSLSAGNAEAPLLFFESIAVVWLLTEEKEGESRLVPTLALCGAALTKVEGLAAVVLIALGSFLREGSQSRGRALVKSLALVAWPVASVSVWFVYQSSRSMPAGYRPHGEFLSLYTDNLAVILKEMVASLNAGSLWLPWLIVFFFLARSRSAWRAAAPALTLAFGLMLFFVFDYLHDKDNPAERIRWTAPRVTQPALSAAILGAGVLSAGSGRRRRAESPPT
jgi:hypothetical protein